MTERTAAGPEPQAPPSMPCPVCKGDKTIGGWLLTGEQRWADLECPECGGIGQVPAEPQYQELLEALKEELLEASSQVHAMSRMPSHSLQGFDVCRASVCRQRRRVLQRAEAPR